MVEENAAQLFNVKEVQRRCGFTDDDMRIYWASKSGSEELSMDELRRLPLIREGFETAFHKLKAEEEVELRGKRAIN